MYFSPIYKQELFPMMVYVNVFYNVLFFFLIYISFRIFGAGRMRHHEWCSMLQSQTFYKYLTLYFQTYLKCLELYIKHSYRCLELYLQIFYLSNNWTLFDFIHSDISSVFDLPIIDISLVSRLSSSNLSRCLVF